MSEGGRANLINKFLDIIVTYISLRTDKTLTSQVSTQVGAANGYATAYRPLSTFILGY